MNDIVLAIIVFAAVLLGWSLRGVRVKKLNKVAHSVEQRVRKMGKRGKGEVLAYNPPISAQKETEEKARESVEEI